MKKIIKAVIIPICFLPVIFIIMLLPLNQQLKNLLETFAVVACCFLWSPLLLALIAKLPTKQRKTESFRIKPEIMEALEEMAETGYVLTPAADPEQAVFTTGLRREVPHKSYHGPDEYYIGTLFWDKLSKVADPAVNLPKEGCLALYTEVKNLDPDSPPSERKYVFEVRGEFAPSGKAAETYNTNWTPFYNATILWGAQPQITYPSLEDPRLDNLKLDSKEEDSLQKFLIHNEIYEPMLFGIPSYYQEDVREYFMRVLHEKYDDWIPLLQLPITDQVIVKYDDESMLYIFVKAQDLKKGKISNLRGVIQIY